MRHILSLLGAVASLSNALWLGPLEAAPAGAPVLHRPQTAVLTALDLAGAPAHPFPMGNVKATVLLFVSTDCPIANRYAPEIRRLQELYAPKQIRFWLVYADPETSAEAIRGHLAEYHLPATALRDPQHVLVKMARARVTPEAAVFISPERLVYHGRIDNRYVDFGKMRPAPTIHDLQEVLEAVLAGQSAPRATAPAVGCYLSDQP